MRRALVTGGSGGIGAAICRNLATAGFQVYSHAHSKLDAAQQVVADIMASGGSAEAVAFDVTDAQATKAAIEAILADGVIQVLVNNAGIHDDAVFPGMRAEQWHRVIDVSLDGFFNVTQPLTMPMIRSRWGRIINITSIFGQTGQAGQANYAASKAGLIGLTMAIAREVGSRNITCNAVAPGFIETAMTSGLGDDFKQNAVKMIPLGRVGSPEDVANAVVFLASEEASYISGHVLNVNGGMLMG